MGDKTKISWTDYTFNPWWGCARISPGCDNCYAAAIDKRYGGNYWDASTKPRRTGNANWKKPLAWNKRAEAEGRRLRVFCGSMMDWCDKYAPEGALDDLWELIRNTPRLDWQLLTKRAGRIKKCLPEDWGDGYKNVWLGVTCEDIKHGYPRINELRNIPAHIRFISAEPLLEDITPFDLTGIDWVIIGGESGPGYRPMGIEWAVDLLGYCILHGVPAWFKQHGGNTKDKGGCLVDGSEFKQWPKEVEGE